MHKTFMAHHGIKGMRWGVRRFQYDDGSLTPAGKKRYGSKEEYYKAINKTYGSVENMQNIQKRNVDNLDKTGKILNESSNILYNASKIGTNTKKSKIVEKPDYSKLSDEELRKKINRINMERSYGELTGDVKRVRSGEDWAREALQTTGAVVGIAAGITGIALTIVENNKKKKGGG
ncbi:MAG: hypothetical protein ACNA7U_03820 [Candidatus Izemoplasmataceae bacterium]